MRRPVLITANRRVYAQIGTYQGATFLKTCQTVVVRQQVRLYKFFMDDRQLLNISPSFLVTSKNRIASCLSCELPTQPTVVEHHFGTFDFVRFGDFRNGGHCFQFRAMEIADVHFVAVHHVNAQHLAVFLFPLRHLFGGNAAVDGCLNGLFHVFFCLVFHTFVFLVIPFYMGRDKFKFHLLPSIALFPFAAVAFELTVTDFVRGYNTAVGKIGYCNVKGGDVLYAAVGGLPLDSLHFFLIQDNFLPRE